MVVSFADLTANQRAAAGGKGSTLCRLFQSGYPVPDGFIILPKAFAGDRLTTQAWLQVEAQLARLRGGQEEVALAIRSSGLSEDGARASFAGEFETVLDVKTEAALRQAIADVHRSGHSERVQAYSRAQKLNDQQAVAVVVQRMVPSRLAGVMFTADPLTGDHSCMVGNFVPGLGHQLVSGQVTGEAFKLARPNGTYQGPEALRPVGRQLFQLARQLEDEFGQPQDIEWAVAEGKLHLLQTRPITTLQAVNHATGEWNDSLRGNYLWSNSNFGEAFPDVMTPLTWSLVQIYAQETFGVPVPGHHPLMGNIAGRFYVNLSLFASVMTALGFSRERVNYESEEFFGNLPEDVDVPIIPFSRWALLRRYLPFAVKALWRKYRNRRGLDEFTARMPERCADLCRQIQAGRTTADLANLWRQQLEPLLRRACQMLQAGTSGYENAARPLRHQLRPQVGEADANTLLSGLSHGEDQLASLGPVVGLWRVAQGQMSRQEFRQRYGHRGPHEMELSLPRPAEDPDWIDRQLETLAGMDVPGLLAKRQAERAAAWTRYEQEHPRRAEKTRQRLHEAAVEARRREAIRSEVTRLFGVARAFALRAGQLTGLDDDVFFLSVEELIGRLSGDESALTAVPARRQAHQRLSALPPYPALIKGRFDPTQWATDPDRRSDIYDTDQEPAEIGDSADLIRGFPGANGIVESTVRRLDRAEDGHLLQAGEILVTTTTNVGWTPLFPRAAAVVTDVGAPLSHAAIVARELGIPAVVGCGQATMRLKTGDRVRVNGGRGTVKVVLD